MTPLEIVLALGWAACLIVAYARVRAAERRIVHLQHLLDECRRNEQRYQAALLKARTP